MYTVLYSVSMYPEDSGEVQQQSGCVVSIISDEIMNMSIKERERNIDYG